MKSTTTLTTEATTVLLDLGSKILNLTDDAVYDELEDIQVHKDAELHYYLVWQEDSITRNITFHLNGERASASMLGVFLGTSASNMVLNSTMIHHAPHTTGNTLVKGALFDQSQAELRGMIKIAEGAQASNDLLTERVLLLSEKAHAVAEPMLEIEANEVKATHAATISQINADHMYYLQSRGIAKDVAEKLILDGFLQEVLDYFPTQVVDNLPKSILAA